MPKVYLTEADRLREKLAAYVYGQMKVHRVSQRTLAKKRGISHQALSQKLLRRSFDYEDFVFFVQEFEPSQKELLELVGM